MEALAMEAKALEGGELEEEAWVAAWVAVWAEAGV
jgi:hypothetical protein